MKMWKEEKDYVNWLYHVQGIGRKKLREILSHEISPGELYEMKTGTWQKYLFEHCHFTKRQAETTSAQIETWKRKMTPQQLAEEHFNRKIFFLLPGDPGYPVKLEKIPDPPFGLYAKGDRRVIESMEHRGVAVIGARECSQYGRSVAKLLGERCAAMGMCVISGMAYGVDGIAQASALARGGRVAAVLGSGVDVCYPYSNRKLYEELCRKGCIYSEYVPKTEPRPSNFPPRNRIISGMADALIVVEAKEKSGTLITVDMALEQGKEVYVIPGRISDPMSMGCNRLIKQGACMVCDVDEVLEEIAQNAGGYAGKISAEEEREAKAVAPGNPYLSDTLRHRIYAALDVYPKSVQQIYESAVWEDGGMNRPPVEQIQTELFYMQMEGAIWESGGRFGVK